MKTTFWAEEKSPKQFFEEYIKPEKPNATLWDVFLSYEPVYQEPANTSEAWLKKQAKLIDEIVEKHFLKPPLSITDIEDITVAIQEFTYPEDQQDYIQEEGINPNFIAIAKTIAKNYINPLKLSENSIAKLIDALDDKLQKVHKKHIYEVQKEVMRENFRNKYPEAKAAQMIQNLEVMWKMGEAEEDDNYYDDIEDEELKVEDYFIYPKFTLAYSNSIYDFEDEKDCLSNKTREQLANKTFIVYKNEISELLNQQPDAHLQPETIPFKKLKEAAWSTYSMYFEENPFAEVFEGEFAIWKGSEKVLFLTLNQGEKELPYEIHLNGLILHKYTEELTKYHDMIKRIKSN